MSVGIYGLVSYPTLSIARCPGLSFWCKALDAEKEGYGRFGGGSRLEDGQRGMAVLLASKSR